jgi:hypothetical protein
MTRKSILKKQRIQEDKTQMRMKESLSLKRQKLEEEIINKRTRNYERSQENFYNSNKKISNKTKIIVHEDESELNSCYRKFKSVTSNSDKAKEFVDYLSSPDKLKIIMSLVGINHCLCNDSRNFLEFFYNEGTFTKIIEILQNLVQDNCGAGFFKLIVLGESLEILEKVTKSGSPLNLYLYEKGLLDILITLFPRLGAFNIIQRLILLINNLAQEDSKIINSSLLNNGYLTFLIVILKEEKYKDLREISLNTILNLVKISDDLSEYAEDLHALLLNIFSNFKSFRLQRSHVMLEKDSLKIIFPLVKILKHLCTKFEVIIDHLIKNKVTQYLLRIYEFSVLYLDPENKMEEDIGEIFMFYSLYSNNSMKELVELGLFHIIKSILVKENRLLSNKKREIQLICNLCEDLENTYALMKIEGLFDSILKLGISHPELKSETDNLLCMVILKMNLCEEFKTMLNYRKAKLEGSLCMQIKTSESTEIKEVQETLKKMNINSDLSKMNTNINMDFLDFIPNENWIPTQVTEQDLNSQFKLFYKESEKRPDDSRIDDKIKLQDFYNENLNIQNSLVNGRSRSTDPDRTVSMGLPDFYNFNVQGDPDVTMTVKSEFFN